MGRHDALRPLHFGHELNVMEVRALLQGFGFNSQRPCTCGVQIGEICPFWRFCSGLTSFLSADLTVHPAVTILCTSCVQEGGFEGPENGPKQRRINNRLLSYRPVRKTFCYLSMPPAISSNLRLTALTAQIPHSALARPPAPL